MNRSKPFCWGSLVLALSLGIVTGVGYWLWKDRPYVKVHDLLVMHDRLLVEGKRKEAYALFEKALKEQGDGPLSPYWLPMVRALNNGYRQLEYLLRIVEADPERRATYEELANLLKAAPESFQKEVRPRFLADLAAVPEVNRRYLKKYGLLQ